MLWAVRMQRGNLKNPPVARERFVRRLEELELVETAALLRRVMDSI